MKRGQNHVSELPYGRPCRNSMYETILITPTYGTYIVAHDHSWKDLINSFQNQFWSPSNSNFWLTKVSTPYKIVVLDKDNSPMVPTPTMAISAPPMPPIANTNQRQSVPLLTNAIRRRRLAEGGGERRRIGRCSGRWTTSITITLRRRCSGVHHISS